MATNNQDKIRLSDTILTALQLSLKQGDLDVAKQLNSALEISMTRKAGGGNFVERRNFPKEMADALDKLNALKAEKR